MEKAGVQLNPPAEYPVDPFSVRQAEVRYPPSLSACARSVRNSLFDVAVYRRLNPTVTLFGFKCNCMHAKSGHSVIEMHLCMHVSFPQPAEPPPPAHDGRIRPRAPCTSPILEPRPRGTPLLRPLAQQRRALRSVSPILLMLLPSRLLVPRPRRVACPDDDSSGCLLKRTPDPKLGGPRMPGDVLLPSDLACAMPVCYTTLHHRSWLFPLVFFQTPNPLHCIWDLTEGGFFPCLQVTTARLSSTTSCPTIPSRCARRCHLTRGSCAQY